ncbi:2-methylisocitrate lyase-like PEP mutase family enzyme [Skermanella aerolata]|uniref:Uncharacterized protein n=1 Tax=Skermanella aerolata TaxID=393310 RepID=A0A512DLG6_9PROT|nr:hypothetical protein [Skermanella aerolata]KJB96428.1 hypothetical protein N826_34840 [Skermanella aerolata KACC 11604]GEO37326.1 hypothetical protein SAE02_14740 [Skermanella aerolata]
MLIIGPKVVSVVDGNETTGLTASDLQEMGFDVVFYAVSAIFTAVKAVGDTLEELKRTGTPKRRKSDMVSYAEFSGVVDLPFHQNWADRFGG